VRALPYFRWFTADAKADEKYGAMSDTELGFFHRCLNHSWDNDGLPSDLDELAAVMHATREYVDQVWARVGKCWYADGSRLFNRRQEEERKYAISKSERNAGAARARYVRNANAVQTQSECTANGSQRAYESESVSVKPKEPIPFRERKVEPEMAFNEIADWFEERMQRHPRKNDAMLAQGLLSEIPEAKDRAWRAEFTRVHNLWCDSEMWQWKSGARAPTMAQWITDKGWKYPPGGHEAKPAKPVYFDPRSITG
jgi:uncharacterized protein YdaU (DUF1376 family)